MRKNLLFLHLESVSNTILWQYRIELATTWRIFQHSFAYTHYYSSSVSTDTVLDELLYGTSDVYDASPKFGERFDLTNPALAAAVTCNSLESFAFFEGYDYFNFIEYPWCNGIEDSTHFYHPNMELVVARLKDRMRAGATSGKPFVLHFRVVVSHMAYDDPVKIRAATFSERFRLGYQRQDQAVAMAMSALDELGLLENTTVVFYGDHGDELWSHGLNTGYCHSIIPYASLCWTPLFIYEHGKPGGVSDRIVSTIDLRESLVKRMCPEYNPENHPVGVSLKNRLGETKSPPRGWPVDGVLPPFRSTRFEGIDAFNEERELAFTQNLFALQLEYSDPECGLTKGYSVTDGIYRVVVASGGDNPKAGGGIEFFCDRLDPFNKRNLLDFFKLDPNGDIREFYPPTEAFVREFSLLFGESAIDGLKQTYARLKGALHEFVRAKEEKALRHLDGRKHHVMPETAFRHSRKRAMVD